MLIEAIPIDLSVLNVGMSGGVRASGLHASDLYNDFYQDLEPNRYRRDGELPPAILLETGLVFERVLEEGLARRAVETGQGQIVRPGEFTHEDTFEGTPVRIHYNPDLFIFNGCMRIGEIKATWLSSKIPHEYVVDERSRAAHADDIANAMMNPKFDKYYTQLKLYCAMQGTPYGRLYVWFIAGDYTRPFLSQLVAADIEFTPDELESNYRMLMLHGLHKGLIG